MKKNFYPLPIIYETTYKYLDVNKDKNLRELVVNNIFNIIKNNNKYNLSEEELKKKIYKKLHKFIKLTNINWYDIKYYEKDIIKLFI